MLVQPDIKMGVELVNHMAVADNAGDPPSLVGTMRAAPWIAETEPSSVHNPTTAATHVPVPGALHASAARGATLADSGYDCGEISVNAPIKQPNDNLVLSPDNQAHRLLRAPRCPANVDSPCSKATGTPQHVTVSSSEIGGLARPALVLNHFERDYLLAFR
ncbi:hypothetical protein ACWEJ6_52330 [Nonomuraea sp. NPDC004702]